MSIQSALVAIKTNNSVLNTLIGTRFHPDELPQNVVFPAVRFQVISRPNDDAMGPVIVNSRPRVQMDDYVKSVRSGGTTTRTQMRDALLGAFYGYSGTIGGETIKSMVIDNEAEDIAMPNTVTEADHIRIDFLISMA